MESADHSMQDHHSHASVVGREEESSAASVQLSTSASPSAPPPPASNLLFTGAIILTWYGISNSIILVTKWLFSNYFAYPLTVTVYSNVITFLWAFLLSRHPAWRIPWPTKQQFRNFILPIGLTTGLEIGSSNLALKLLTVSFGTILKGAAPVFTFLWGYLFGVEMFSCQIFGSLLIISLGIVLATLGEGHEFQLAGFLLQLFGTSLGGLRWALTHKLLLQQNEENTADEAEASDGITHAPVNIRDDDESETPPMLEHRSDLEVPGDEQQQQEQHSHSLSPLGAILYTSPVTALGCLPFALGFEASQILQQASESVNGTAVFGNDFNTTSALLSDLSSTTSDSPPQTVLILATMTLIASLVFCVLMSEYWLVKATSSLALSVAGVLKELLTIGGGIFFFSESIDWLNVTGFVTCQAGIMAYVFMRYEPPKAGETYEAVTPDDITPLRHGSRSNSSAGELPVYDQHDGGNVRPID